MTCRDSDRDTHCKGIDKHIRYHMCGRRHMSIIVRGKEGVIMSEGGREGSMKGGRERASEGGREGRKE